MPRTLASSRPLAVALLLGSISINLTAQCEPEWLEVEGANGTNSAVFASVMWDRDGAGPAPAQLVVGGAFLSAGGRLIEEIARYDSESGEWQPLGEIPGDNVYSLATDDNGELYALTNFFGPPGAADRVVQWSGTDWIAIGETTNGAITSITTLPNGDVVVGGTFTDINGFPANQVARWNGGIWQAMGAGFNGAQILPSSVMSLTTLPNGDVVAGGDFTVAGGNPADFAAVWNGIGWLPIGAGPGDEVLAMITMPNGDLVAAGRFGTPAFGLAIWDGVAWTFDGALNLGFASTLTTVGNDLIVGGDFDSFGGVTAANAARRNGTTWSAMGAGFDYEYDASIRTVTTLPNGNVFAGGAFDEADGEPANNCATWDGSAWVTTTLGFSTSDVNVVTTLANGNIVIGGSFTEAVQTPANRIAEWTGSEWVTLDTGLNDDVHALLTMPNGDLIVGGSFTTAGGITANRVARWNGTSWSAMGSGMNDEVTALMLTPTGTIVAGGNFTMADGVTVNRVATWSGTTWQALGNGVNAKVLALATMANGDVVAGGQFTNASGTPASGIGRWDGTSWHAFGSGLNNLAESLYLTANGDLIAGGLFTTAGGVPAPGIARWDGAGWNAMGSGVVGYFGTPGTVKSMTMAPGGDLIAAGNFFSIDGLATIAIARWDGSTWSPLNETIAQIAPGNAFISSVCTTPDGRIIAAGNIVKTDDIPSQGLSILASPCPATADASATGCVGSGGVNELSAQQLPWIGGSYSAIATGMPIDSLAIELFGFAPISTPLASLLPQAAAGCDLLTTVDGIAVHLTTTGTVQTELPIPDDPALVGGMLYQQVVPLDLDAGGNIVEITATNRLDVVIGAF